MALLALLSRERGASAQTPWSRHPQQLDSRRKPAGVPADYVFTHNGFMHPSCVTFLQSDEILDRDLVIRGRDGSVRDRISECAYPRYDFAAQPISTRATHGAHPAADGGSSAGGGSSGAGGRTYDGWLIYYAYKGSPSSGSNLSTKWVVPTPPTNVDRQDIAFFSDFQSFDDLGTPTSIIQPVLDFGELLGHWAMEAEILIGNNDVQSSRVAVNPGDTLLGTITSAGCAPSGVCQTWTITVEDLESGKSTTATTTALTDAPKEVDPAVLETYDVDSCDKLPASGEVLFFDNALTTASGGAEPETYSFNPESANQVASEVPSTCGWNGTSTGNDFTLIFSTSLTLPPGYDAGAGGSPGSLTGAGSGGALENDGGAGAGGPSPEGRPSSGCSAMGRSEGDSGLVLGLGIAVAFVIRRRRSG